MDAAAVDQKIHSLASCIETTVAVSATEKLLVGVDLGTAYIVVVVLNHAQEPVACALEFAQVIKDGLVVDYMGAVTIVKKLVGQLEQRLGRTLAHAATAVPPGTSEKDSSTHRHVVEAAGLEVTTVLDEPTAANSVLGIENGAIVDIGGGTTGISILEKGQVTYVADEATGGTHLSLVLAGNYKIPFEQAELLKKDTSRQAEVLGLVRPVIQKMATIVNTHIKGRNVSALYLVGGTCCLKGMEQIIAKETGKPVYKPANPFLVTPLGIAMHCKV